MPKKILFIMCDQLRFDYLGCAGHSTIRTPNIDALAKRGVRFDRCYVQSPICGPSRMSTYTGRYVRSHGSTWNLVPLRVGEMTMGDHLRPLGVRSVLCGKTHMTADREGMERLGLDPGTGIGALVSECGFEVWDRNDGVVPDGAKKQPSHYQDYLRGLGYDGPNPWHQWANSAVGNDGEILSGWFLEHAAKPARVAEEASETPYATSRAIEFMEGAKNESWMLHLSYIKPHWPYIVPAPYHSMYGPEDVLPPVRSEKEKQTSHPLMQAFYKHRYSQAFSRADVRETVIPAYMGLITQIDDQIGRIVQYLEDSGQAEETMIVFTSDHGDYLGDHWLGEKELFHDPSVRIPMIIMDPSPVADATRGYVNSELIESIDLAPTFVDFYGGKAADHVLEGNSLMPAIHGTGAVGREFVISEYDYATRKHLRGISPSLDECKLTMLFDGRWKLVWVEGHAPMLYDLENDPQELTDLGTDPDHSDILSRLSGQLFKWYRVPHNRVTLSDALLERISIGEEQFGIYLGFWNKEELDEWRASNDT